MFQNLTVLKLSSFMPIVVLVENLGRLFCALSGLYVADCSNKELIKPLLISPDQSQGNIKWNELPREKH